MDNDCDGSVDEGGVCNYDDADNDGVIDLFDSCPGTPQNTYVNSVGCELQIEMQMIEGWNLIAYFGENRSIQNVLENVISTVGIVYGYENGMWKSYNASRPINSLEEMKKGFGYWVKTLTSSTWRSTPSHIILE